MAQYIRFEIYIPTHFKVTETTGRGRRISETFHSTNPKLIVRLNYQILRQFGGVTEANPLAPSMYRGLWRPEQSSSQAKQHRRESISVDHLTFIFGLVRIDKEDRALKFFARWKRKLEKDTHQNVILVTYHTVHVMGEI